MHGGANFRFKEVFERRVYDFDVDFVFAGVDERLEIALDVVVPKSASAHGVDESSVDGLAHEFAFSGTSAQDEVGGVVILFVVRFDFKDFAPRLSFDEIE